MEIRELVDFMGFIGLLVSNVTECEIVFEEFKDNNPPTRIKYIAASDDHPYGKFIKEVEDFFKYDTRYNVNIDDVQFCMNGSLIIYIYY